MNVYLVDFIVVLVCSLLVWLRSQSSHRRRNPRLPLPPGPKGLPLVGNVFDLPPSDSMWVGLAEWGKSGKYGKGDLIHVNIIGRHMIFLNTYEAASDLLDKRSVIYSDRFQPPMIGDLMGWDWSLTILRCGEIFRKQRYFLNQFLRPLAVPDYYPIQTLEAHRFIQNMMETPKSFADHVRRNAGATIMMIAYGHEVAAEGEDQFISIANKAIDGISQAAVPGAFLVDTLPWLKYVPEWFPGAGFKAQAKEWRKWTLDLLHVPYRVTKQKILDGTARPSIMTKLLELCTDDEGHIRDEDIIEASTAIIYAGGADTTVATMMSVILAFLLHPEAQSRGQAEIDSVIGASRLPTFEDRNSLPYVNSIVKEALRWSPVLPLGLPHTVVEDDVYNGHFIPAGSAIFPNQWAMLHDEEIYPDPLAFKPERWLPQEGKEPPREPAKASFGFGRRICPGRYLADNSLFIGIATMLATLNFDKTWDKDGNPIKPEVVYKPGFLSHPEAFECTVTPRSSAAVTLIREAVESSN